MRSLFHACTGLLVLCLLVATAQPAFAYGDPGTGLLVLQSAGAVVSGVLFFLRKHLRALLNRRRGSDANG